MERGEGYGQGVVAPPLEGGVARPAHEQLAGGWEEMGRGVDPSPGAGRWVGSRKRGEVRECEREEGVRAAAARAIPPPPAKVW